MARGTQHRKRRPPADARAARVAPAKRPRGESWEDQLFFSRLRRHAKWVYVLLAVFFAGGFIFLGVGSGSTGIGDVLQNFFNSNSSSGSSLSSLEKKTRNEPGNAQAWRDLATKLEQDQKNDRAVDALVRYTALRPKDESALQELAGLYTRKGDDLRAEAQLAQYQASLVAPGATFSPASSSTFGKIYTDPNALQDPVANAVTQQANTTSTDIITKLSGVEAKAVAVYKRLAAADPTDATRQVQLGQAAQNANDTVTAIAAYKKFLKLAPDDPLAPAVKQALKQLTAGTTSVTGSG